MNDKVLQTLTPESCATTIFEMSGVSFDADIAFDLWLKILNHKWLLSEKVGRDMGMRTACIDFLENMKHAPNEYQAYKRQNILKEMGAQKSSREIGTRSMTRSPPNNWSNAESFFP